MKLILLLLLIIASSFLICNVSSQFMNFKGSYSSKSCSGKSMGVGYVFSDDYCFSTSDSQSYLFNISYGTGYIYEFVDGSDCYGETFSNVEKVQPSCSLTPQFLNSTTDNQYSQVTFTQEPDYELNSLVMAKFLNERCMDLEYAVTYSNGYTFTDGEGVSTTYTCVKNVPYIKQCVTSSQCTTKKVLDNCDVLGRSVFCASNS